MLPYKAADHLGDEHPLRTKRIELRLTQAELSRRCGIGLNNLSAIETGFARYPSLPTLAAVCRVLGVTMDEMYAELEAWNLKHPRIPGEPRRISRRAS